MKEEATQPCCENASKSEAILGSAVAKIVWLREREKESDKNVN